MLKLNEKDLKKLSAKFNQHIKQLNAKEIKINQQEYDIKQKE